MPEPRGDQALPFQRAILLALAPPALVKKPPAYRLPSGPNATALTMPTIPLPRGD